MKKLVSTLGLFLSFLIQDIAAFQPPSQENQRLIKKNEPKLSQFVTSTRGWFGGVAEIHRLIREGVLITPEDLDQLLDLGPGSDGLYNIEFWTQNGSYFLMYASMGPSTVFPEVKSLKDLAASQVSKKEKLKGRYVTQAADLRRAIRSNASLPEIEEEVTRIFAEVAAQIKKTRGGFESLQKTKIRDEFRAKGQKRLDDLWQDILATRPTGFSVVVLEYIVNALSRSEDFVSDVPLIGQGQKKEILQRYVDEWIKKRCEDLLRIIAHLRARNAIASIIKSTEERYRDAAEAGQMSDRARVMYLHKDMVNLLQATPQTCPAVISPLLLQRLGDRAKTILEGK